MDTTVLCILFLSSQVSLKGLAELAAVQCTLMPLRQFVDCSCGQFALLGLQFSWTAQVIFEPKRRRRNKCVPGVEKSLLVIQREGEREKNVYHFHRDRPCNSTKTWNKKAGTQ